VILDVYNKRSVNSANYLQCSNTRVFKCINREEHCKSDEHNGSVFHKKIQFSESRNINVKESWNAQVLPCIAGSTRPRPNEFKA
jgi:hypothetical protein